MTLLYVLQISMTSARQINGEISLSVVFVVVSELSEQSPNI